MVDHKIRELLLSLNKIALAVSGGSDSMALLHWCIINIPRDKFYVVNLEHGIRGAESCADSAFVKEYCQANAVEFVCHSVDSPKFARDHGMTLEQAARVLRYDIFAQEAISTANAILTAHHSGDLAESILMHIARGSGIGGLIGMEIVNGHIIRPLLNTSKLDIMQYIKNNSIPYRTDSSNSDNTYTRNYIRNIAIPTLKKPYPTIEKMLIKLSDRATEIIQLLDSLTPPLEVISGVIKLNLNDTLPALAKHIILKACFLLAIDKDIETRHLDDIIQLSSLKNGAHIDLPHGLKAFKEGREIVLTTNQLTDESVYPLKIGVYSFCNGDIVISHADCNSSLRSTLDADKIPSDTIIRTKRIGDKIKLSYGSKSLGDYFTDTKTPRRLRQTIPLLAIGNNIIAIADQAVGTDFSPSENSKNLIEIQYISKDKIYE